MSYALSPNAAVCLRAQTNLSGSFRQILRNRVSGESIYATLNTELCADQVRVEIRMGSTRNTLTLPANSTYSAAIIAQHLEAIANGQLDTAQATPVDPLPADQA